MRKTAKEFEKAYFAKIRRLEEGLKEKDRYPLCSSDREECANSMAVLLRALLCYVSGTESLCKRCGFTNQLLLAFRCRGSSINILPSYDLVQMKIEGTRATFETMDLSEEKGKVFRTCVKLSNWLDEIAVDFKTSDLKPLSRRRIIRIVADELGAHVDSEYNPYLYKIAHENVMPVQVVINGKVVDVDCNNLFTETIFTIAQELINASLFINKTKYKSRRYSDNVLYIQAFEENAHDSRSKYIICPPEFKINPYNSNRFFECKTYIGKLYLQEIVIGDKKYIIEMIESNCKRTPYKNNIQI